MHFLCPRMLKCFVMTAAMALDNPELSEWLNTLMLQTFQTDQSFHYCDRKTYGCLPKRVIELHELACYEARIEPYQILTVVAGRTWWRTRYSSWSGNCSFSCIHLVGSGLEGTRLSICASSTHSNTDLRTRLEGGSLDYKIFFSKTLNFKLNLATWYPLCSVLSHAKFRTLCVNLVSCQVSKLLWVLVLPRNGETHSIETLLSAVYADTHRQ